MLAGGSKGLFTLYVPEWRLFTLVTRRYVILFVSSAKTLELRSWRSVNRPLFCKRHTPSSFVLPVY